MRGYWKGLNRNVSFWLQGLWSGEEQEVQLGSRHKAVVTWARIEVVEVMRDIWNLCVSIF